MHSFSSVRSAVLIDALSDLFILRGVPGHVRSDNGPEFVARAVQEWIAAVGARTAYIESGSPWENGYVELFNGGCVMSYSMARSSTPCVRPRSSSRAGAATTMRSGHMHRSAIALPPQRFLCRRLPRGRLRNFNSCAGHASVAHETKPKLTSYPDHSVGADQIASATVLPCESNTSTWRNLATISSGLYLFFPITVLLRPKAILPRRTTSEGVDQ